jgi:hypothetical protein
VPWTTYVTDKFIAPELSKFTSATLPDLSAIDKEQEHWLANYILNSILRVNVPSPDRQRYFNFLRRSHSAFEEYAAARDLTLKYLADRERQLGYLKAMGHWEALIAYLWQAYRCVLRCNSHSDSVSIRTVIPEFSHTSNEVPLALA